jgi:S-formylglutathione hydrolase
MESQGKPPYPAGILIDQGLADKFLIEKQLLPSAGSRLRPAGPAALRRHAGYDHGYYFIQTFIDDHLRHHAQQLQA